MEQNKLVFSWNVEIREEELYLHVIPAGREDEEFVIKLDYLAKIIYNAVFEM